MGLMGGMAALRSGGGEIGDHGERNSSTRSCWEREWLGGGEPGLLRATRHRLFRRTGETG